MAGWFKNPNSRLSLLAIVGPAMILLSLGCDNPQPNRLGRRTVQVSDLPEQVIGAAKGSLPDVEFNDAWKNVDKDGTVHSYEVRGRNKNGKIREVRVSTSGEILEME